MLHIDNREQNFNRDWSMNASQVLLPMTEGNGVSYKESEGATLTFACADESDPSGGETSMVVGVERHYIEPDANKSDLFIVTSSELKLLSGNSEIRNSTGFVLPFTENDKSEMLWGNSFHRRDKVKSDWCPTDKPIYEIKDAINYDTLIQDASKWSNLGKPSQDLAIDCDLRAPKLRDSLLMTAHNVNVYDKISENGISENSHFGMDHISISSNPFLGVNSSSTTFKINLTRKKIEEETGKSGSEDQDNQELQLKKAPDPVFCKKKRRNHYKVNDDVNSLSSCLDGQGSVEDNQISQKGSHDCLPEKSLPLKKKAKMKKTIMTAPCLFKYKALDATAGYSFIKEETFLLKKFNEFAKNHETRIIDPGRAAYDQPCISSLQGSECSDIFEVIDHLKVQKLIDQSVWETLNIGLKEMNADILGEIKSKCNVAERGTIYSAELKAFALMLQFQEPAAFSYLAGLYKNGWPSLSVIEDWKHKINRSKGLFDWGKQKD